MFRSTLYCSALGLFTLVSCQKHYPVEQPTTTTAAAQTQASDRHCLLPQRAPAYLAVTSAEETAASAQPATPVDTAQPDAPAPSGSLPTPSNACIEKAKAIVATLSLPQKLGQMMQPDRGRIRQVSELSTVGFGSVLSGGGSAPTTGNRASDWANMVGEFRQVSLESPTHIPLIYGVDAVHGHNNVHGAVLFPHNIGLGAARDPELVERIGRITAREVRATQIDWTFAPVTTAARDERWGRTYEAFGETQELAELLAPALVRGLQGNDLRDPQAVLATAKHFIGDGYTDRGIDQGNSLLSLERVHTELLPAYKKVIDAGVGSVMASYSSIDGVPMHCHGPLLNDTLKGDLGFRGFIVSDWEAIEKLPGSYAEQIEASLLAGVDMIMAPKTHTDFIQVAQTLVPSRVPMERIDDAVTRILAIKCALGMLDEGHYVRDRSGRIQPDGELVEAFGSAEHREVAREAVQKSLVLLKNDNAALPLKSTESLYVTGTGANDLGRQCGGWTITWQGQDGEVTEGTTLVQALQQRLDPSRVRFSRKFDAALVGDANTVVVVASERPYAEMKGDDATLALNADDVEAVHKLHALGKRVVFVLMSGRPLILTPVLNHVDAIVAAWLPGTEGAGIADVLLGDRNFHGKLPHTWPRSIEQVPINVGDANYDPLFPYGFGLTYPTP